MSNPATCMPQMTPRANASRCRWDVGALLAFIARFRTRFRFSFGAMLSRRGQQAGPRAGAMAGRVAANLKARMSNYGMAVRAKRQRGSCRQATDPSSPSPTTRAPRRARGGRAPREARRQARQERRGRRAKCARVATCETHGAARAARAGAHRDVKERMARSVRQAHQAPHASSTLDAPGAPSALRAPNAPVRQEHQKFKTHHAEPPARQRATSGGRAPRSRGPEVRQVRHVSQAPPGVSGAPSAPGASSAPGGLRAPRVSAPGGSDAGVPPPRAREGWKRPLRTITLKKLFAKENKPFSRSTDAPLRSDRCDASEMPSHVLRSRPESPVKEHLQLAENIPRIAATRCNATLITQASASRGELAGKTGAPRPPTGPWPRIPRALLRQTADFTQARKRLY